MAMYWLNGPIRHSLTLLIGTLPSSPTCTLRMSRTALTSLSLSLSLSLSHLSLSLSLFFSLSLSLFFSLSLSYTYIYIYTHTHTHTNEKNNQTSILKLCPKIYIYILIYLPIYLSLVHFVAENIIRLPSSDGSVDGK